MGAIASQITSLTIVYSNVYSDADQRKHQSPASLAFVRRIHRGSVNSSRKRPVTRKMFPFDDVIMWSDDIEIYTFTTCATPRNPRRHWGEVSGAWEAKWTNWKLRVVTTAILSSPSCVVIVVMTICGATRDDNVGIITALNFHTCGTPLWANCTKTHWPLENVVQILTM